MKKVPVLKRKPIVVFRLLLKGSWYIFFSFLAFTSSAQICPPNIDFETGTFTNWTCYTGSVSAAGNVNTISLVPSGGPVPDRHTMFTASQQTVTDYFGGFPVNCPNGSGHSIKLGNNLGGGQAEGISYEFTIPANRNEYSLIYHYAVVFQDPRHQPYQQPRLELEITNVTDNELIECSSFTFIPIGSGLPGFFLSPYQQDTTNVWCKDWTAVSINLNGRAGKTIRLFFKTADCTFTRHFGYAYIDVNTECSSQFVGATFCPDDTTVNVTAPFGYQNYTWYNSNFSQILGTQQTIRFTPPPPVGSTIAVEVVPFNGYGCTDTLFAKLVDTLTVQSVAGKDTFSCNRYPVQIGANATPGLTYSWSPTTGLSDPAAANPFAVPENNTTYVLTTRNSGGGCTSRDTVLVSSFITDTTLRLLGKEIYCADSGDSSVLEVQPTDSIQWFKDKIPIVGANKTRYKVTQSGSYSALLFNSKKCSISTYEKTVYIEKPKAGINYPVQNALINYPILLQARPIGISAEWFPSTYLNNPLSFSPVFNGSADKRYTIAIKTSAGCTTVDTQLVKTFRELKFYVPSAFTPNQDGLNDFLKPISVGMKEFKFFRVYNRWGQLVFDLKSDSRGWDGNLKGKPQPTQTFVWMAEGIGVDNRIYRQKGTCVLIR